MKKATIREVQHNFSGVLKWVEDGEEVQVMRRNKVVARLIPPGRTSTQLQWPDFVKRSDSIWGKKPSGKAASRILIEDREERI